MVQVAHLYKITNTVTGEYYIGKHNGWTQNGYWGSGNRIQRLIKKYAKEQWQKVKETGHTGHLIKVN